VSSPGHTTDPGDAHEPGDLVTADVFPGPPGCLGRLLCAQDEALGPPEVQKSIRHVGIVKISGRHSLLRSVNIRSARDDLDTVLAEHPTNRLDPETILVAVDMPGYHEPPRSTSMAANKAGAARRISLARRSPPFSLRSRTTSAFPSLVTPGGSPQRAKPASPCSQASPLSPPPAHRFAAGSPEPTPPGAPDGTPYGAGPPNPPSPGRTCT